MKNFTIPKNYLNKMKKKLKIKNVNLRNKLKISKEL